MSRCLPPHSIQLGMYEPTVVITSTNEDVYKSIYLYALIPY